MVLKVHWAQRVRFTIGQWRSWDFVQGQEFSCPFALAQIERLVTRSWMKLISEMLVPSHHLSREKEDTPCWWSHREPRMMVHVSMPFHGQCLPCGTPPFYLIVWVLLVLCQVWHSGFITLGKLGGAVFSPWKNVGEIAGVMRISQPRKQRLDADRNSFFYFSSKETPERIHAFLILHRLKLRTSLAQSEAI